MEKVNPVEMRKTLEVVSLFKKHMIQFVPMPVLSEEDGKKLTTELSTRLDALEIMAVAYEEKNKKKKCECSSKARGLTGKSSFCEECGGF